MADTAVSGTAAFGHGGSSPPLRTKGFLHCGRTAIAVVAKWQTRSVEVAVGKPVRVQVPPTAPASEAGSFLAAPGPSLLP